MSTSDIEKRISIVQFTKDTKWHIWSEQFLARADYRGYDRILNGQAKPPDESDPTTDKDALKLRIANKRAYSDLLLSFNDEVNFGIVSEAKTTELDKGDAYLAWKNLKNKHEPSTTANKVSLKAKFTNSKMTGNRDPDDWITELERLRQKLKILKHEITDDDLMIHIINNIGPTYSNIADQMETDMDKGNLDINDVKNRLRAKYNRLNTFKIKEQKKPEESALLGYSKQYKGRCNKCGKWGHKGADCHANTSKFTPGNNTYIKRYDNSNQNSYRNEHANNVVNNGHQGNSSSTYFDGICNYCKKRGHKISDCRKRLYNEKKKSEGENVNVARANLPKIEEDNEYILAVCEFCSSAEISSEEIWIGDSGASSHMVKSLKGVTDVQDINVDIRLGDGSLIKAVKSGTFKGTVEQVDGTQSKICLKVKYVPDLWCNLLSITTALKNGSTLSNEGQMLILSDGTKKIIFDRQVHAGEGNSMTIKIKPNESVETESAHAATNTDRKTMNVDDLHRLLGHPGEAKIRESAKHMNVNLVGTLTPCVHCNLSKIRQVPIPKINYNKATKIGERICLDISPMMTESISGCKNWLLIIDEYTDMKWSFFIKQKSDLATTILKFLKK